MYEQWMPGSGWSLSNVPLEGGKTVYELHENECLAMMQIGHILSRSGALPSLQGVPCLPEMYQQGTGGNFAVRIDPHSFVGTPQGGDKGNLGPEDFVIFQDVKWEDRTIFYSGSAGKYVSSDALLMCAAFQGDSEIRVWVHLHHPYMGAPHTLKMKYPVIQEENLQEFLGLVVTGARIINLIDHRLDKVPDGQADSVIFLCNSMSEVYDFIEAQVQHWALGENTHQEPVFIDPQTLIV